MWDRRARGSREAVASRTRIAGSRGHGTRHALHRQRFVSTVEMNRLVQGTGRWKTPISLGRRSDLRAILGGFVHLVVIMGARPPGAGCRCPQRCGYGSMTVDKETEWHDIPTVAKCTRHGSRSRIWPSCSSLARLHSPPHGQARLEFERVPFAGLIHWTGSAGETSLDSAG